MGLPNAERNVYSRSYLHALYPDIVSTFVDIRSLYDTFPINTDILFFSQAVEWWYLHQENFDNLINLSGSTYIPLPVLCYENTLRRIDLLYSARKKVDYSRPVSYQPGTDQSKLDIITATSNIYNHALNGEEKIKGKRYLEGEIRPQSSTHILEIIHQYLTQTQSDFSSAELRNSTYFDKKLSCVIEAKDLFYSQLVTTYLATLHSRARK